MPAAARPRPSDTKNDKEEICFTSEAAADNDRCVGRASRPGATFPRPGGHLDIVANRLS